MVKTGKTKVIFIFIHYINYLNIASKGRFLHIFFKKHSVCLCVFTVFSAWILDPRKECRAEISLVTTRRHSNCRWIQDIFGCWSQGKGENRWFSGFLDVNEKPWKSVSVDEERKKRWRPKEKIKVYFNLKEREGPWNNQVLGQFRAPVRYSIHFRSYRQ